MTWLLTSPVSVLRRGWRWLRTMRTAIILLFILAAGSAVGTLIPQRPNTPASVDA